MAVTEHGDAPIQGTKATSAMRRESVRRALLLVGPSESSSAISGLSIPEPDPSPADSDLANRGLP
jgi:hypothetical protein